MPNKKSDEIRQNMLKFINSTIEQMGRSPSVREIQNKLHLTSPSHVDHHLRMLEKAGFISIVPNEDYGIRPIRTNRGILLLGRIAAGEPIEIFAEPDEWIDLGSELAGENHFALEVKGKSMIEDGIFDGDYVCIRKQNTCEHGEIIVAVQRTNPSSATLKRFKLEKGSVRLQPSNSSDSNINPILIPNKIWDKEWEIQGIVIAIFRRCWKPKSSYRRVN